MIAQATLPVHDRTAECRLPFNWHVSDTPDTKPAPSVPTSYGPFTSLRVARFVPDTKMRQPLAGLAVIV